MLSGSDREASYGGDRGQRFPSEAHGDHMLQLIQRRNLAGGVATQGQRQFLGRNATTVVYDGDSPYATSLQARLNGARRGVQGIFGQFLKNWGGPVNGLASRNLADEQVR